uniref:Uncharacterized protein n=1 Tax=Rhizophora mucronata TaxID=61149 RepID=A0A2P2LZT0_RHIMU
MQIQKAVFGYETKRRIIADSGICKICKD